MAKVLGESGRYVSQEATKRQHSIWALCVICMAVLGAIWGFIARASLPWFTLSPVGGLLSSVVLLLVLWLIGHGTFRRMDELEKERNNMRRGAEGEKVVGFILSKLPEEFCVVNDLSTPSGNLDHVVVGPTGVFVIETKNRRGVIGSDGNGELTLNGKPAEQRHVARLVGRMMGVKEKVAVLAPGLDPFFNAVIVFTSAWLEVNRVGKADCVTDDRLTGYIIDHKNGKRLSAKEVALIAQAFASLARMDSDFSLKAGQATIAGVGEGAAGGKPVRAVGGG